MKVEVRQPPAPLPPKEVVITLTEKEAQNLWVDLARAPYTTTFSDLCRGIACAVQL